MGILSRDIRRAFREDIREALQAGDEDEAVALREDRREMRRDRRAERRERGEAPDQVLGKALADIWNEEKAEEFAREELVDIALEVVAGRLDLAAAVNEALDELAEDADDLLDFSGVPVVGGLLELVDGPLFDMFLRQSLRPWVEQEIRKLL